MENIFKIKVPRFAREGQVSKSPYSLTVLREELFSVFVDTIQLIEYFVFFDSPDKEEQIKLKLYKTTTDNKWYDKSYSEEAEWQTPEFGALHINQEIKRAIERHEAQHLHANA